MTTSRQPSADVHDDGQAQAVRGDLVPDQPVADPGAGVVTDDGPETHPHGLEPVAPQADDEQTEAVVASEVHAERAAALSEFSAGMPERPISPAARRTGKVRKARLRLLRVEPWSVMKSAFVLSIAIGITLVVATATLWSVVDAAGVFEEVGGLVTELTESETSSGVVITDYVGFSRVVGLATVIAVVDVVLLTALATLFAFLYNLSASLLGGFEITLAEDD